MVKIRLTTTGARNRRMFRIIAIDESDRRDGSAIEILGFYNPNVKPSQLTVKQDRIDYWKSVGAQMSDGVKKILA